MEVDLIRDSEEKESCEAADSAEAEDEYELMKPDTQTVIMHRIAIFI